MSLDNVLPMSLDSFVTYVLVPYGCYLILGSVRTDLPDKDGSTCIFKSSIATPDLTTMDDPHPSQL